MKKQTILLAILSFLMLRCTKEETGGPLIVPESFPIRFLDLVVGQTSRYVLLSGEHYFDNSLPDDFEYLTDTLVAEIISEDENGFLVKEYFTAGSDAEPTDFDGYFFKDSIFYFYLKKEGETLSVNQGPDSTWHSRLFFSYPTLDLTPIVSPQAEIEGWKTTLSYCECDQTAYDPELELFGKTYNHLNIDIRNSPMQLDGPGTTYVYSAENGLVRSSHYSWWTSTGVGWDLLVE